MAKKRLDKTLADYVVIAICPALIMTLVGSLVFFLMELSYRGQFQSRMQWIMFWFVFAAVLVARIAIEEGREHARTFGLAMGIAAGIAVLRFVDAAIVGWILLAVVWWCSSKLTWDCTLIDESEDASGEGLLQAAGFEKNSEPEDQESKSRANPAKLESATDEKRKDEASKKKSKKDGATQKKEKPSDADVDDSAKPTDRPHAPGVWVVYFSLAALPLFGIGQLLIPATDSDRRSYTFQLLAVYVASAIGLLLMTSFLGLRRYLRQRKLEMPAAMTRGWLGMGIALLVALMLVATVIPRPQGEYTITGLIDKIDAKARQASKFAVIKGDRAEGDGRRIGEQDSKTKQAGEGRPPDQKQSKPGENSKPGGTTSGNAKQGKPGNQDGKDGKSDSKSSESKQGKSSEQADQKSNSNEKSESKDKDAGKDNSQRTAEAQRREKETQQREKETQRDGDKKSEDQKRNPDQTQKPQTPNKPAAATDSMLSNMATWVGSLAKWIIYGLLAIVGVFFIVRHWSQFIEILVKLWTELLSLFGRKQKPTDMAATDDQESIDLSKRPFASFVNPFSTGAADRMSSPQLIRYTFEALEAWSREQDLERHPEQTPLEFADELGRHVPKLANDVAQTAQLYVQIAYARTVPTKERLEVLARLWRRLSA